MVGLGTLPGGVFGAAAVGVSADGSVVVGSSSADGSPYVRRAFRWTQSGGMVSVVDWLRANGVNVAPGVELRSANAADADGSVVVGEIGPEASPFAQSQAYLARVACMATA